MKKVLLILGIIFVLLVAAAFILPVVFKDDIKAAIDKELAASVNADVIFDVDNFSLSMFRNFPNITATMSEAVQAGKGKGAAYMDRLLSSEAKAELQEDEAAASASAEPAAAPSASGNPTAD